MEKSLVMVIYFEYKKLFNLLINQSYM